MPSETLHFEGARGERLAARLDLPGEAPRASVLFAHCFTCSKDIHAARAIARALTARGLAVLRFDFAGLGDGTYDAPGFAANIEDLTRAADLMAQRELAPAVLVGHSLGGAAVIRAAHKLKSVRAVATIGAPFDPGHVAHLFDGAEARIEAEGAAEVDIGGRPVRIDRAFLRDLENDDAPAAIGGLKRALLVLHAPRDMIVGIDNAAEIFRAAKHPKSFVSLDDADHLLSRGADADYAAEVIAAWAARYLDKAPATSHEDALPPEGVLRVSEADPDGFLQHVSDSHDHRALADEPSAFGGTNKGFTPYQFLAAGLGACTTMTIRMYARRKKIALTHVSVDVRHDKVHAEDCADCEKGAKIDRFERIITLEGDLDEGTRARLLEIADKCPVHRTLHSRIDIETRLAEGASGTSG